MFYQTKNFSLSNNSCFTVWWKISNLDAIRTPILIHDVNALEPNGEYLWFQSLLQPASTPPIEGEYLHWDDNVSLKQNFQNQASRIKELIKSSEKRL